MLFTALSVSPAFSAVGSNSTAAASRNRSAGLRTCPAQARKTKAAQAAATTAPMIA